VSACSQSAIDLHLHTDQPYLSIAGADERERKSAHMLLRAEEDWAQLFLGLLDSKRATKMRQQFASLLIRYHDTPDWRSEVFTQGRRGDFATFLKGFLTLLWLILLLDYFTTRDAQMKSLRKCCTNKTEIVAKILVFGGHVQTSSTGGLTTWRVEGYYIRLGSGLTRGWKPKQYSRDTTDQPVGTDTV